MARKVIIKIPDKWCGHSADEWQADETAQLES